MDSIEPQRELLVRYLEGRVPPPERHRVTELLRTDPKAREFLREVAEQSVMVADLERMALGRQQELLPRATHAAANRRTVVPVRFRPWRRGVAAAAAVAVLVVVASQLVPAGKPWILRVSKVTGSSQFFGSRGELENALEAGARLRAGDTLETRSCDAWVELELRDGSKMTIGGHSTLRILESEAEGIRFNLERGSLWASPAHRPAAPGLVIQTPTLALEARRAQFDLQTSAAETMVRVNEGSARVRQHLDGSVVEVRAGHQVTAALGRNEPFVVLPQPEPVNYWACDLGGAPEVILGRWLPPNDTERARLGAQPLLWPLPGRDPVMLHAAALSVSRSSDRPVLLQAGSKLLFRGRTERSHMVRFGFSTQKMRGVFAGKFEVDVRPDSLGPAGEVWEVTLSLPDFRPLQPQLSFSPDGLELTDVYALTIREDAGLELNHIELLPVGSSEPPMKH
jgi:ferric-dicitrate binding protein FerR (iron transport regulator)